MRELKKGDRVEVSKNASVPSIVERKKTYTAKVISTDYKNSNCIIEFDREENSIIENYGWIDKKLGDGAYWNINPISLKLLVENKNDLKYF